jgi:hypothetical protein
LEIAPTNSAGWSENLKTELAPLSRAITAQPIAGSNLYARPARRGTGQDQTHKTIETKKLEPTTLS